MNIEQTIEQWASKVLDGSKPAEVAPFSKISMPLIRAAMPAMTINNLVNVQPMAPGLLDDLLDSERYNNDLKVKQAAEMERLRRVAAAPEIVGRGVLVVDDG
jgi:hypothetical protein